MLHLHENRCSFACVLPSTCSAPLHDFGPHDSVSHRRLLRTSELGFFKLLMMLLLNEFGHDTGYFPIVNRRTQSSSRLRPPAIEHTVNLLNRSCLLLLPSLNQVSSFIIFFTRASWASTVALSTIALFLITCRIECVTTFAQAFRRSGQTARCALHRTSLFAG